MRTYILLLILSVTVLVLMPSSQAAPKTKQVNEDSSSSEESVEVVKAKKEKKEKKHDDSSDESSEETFITQKPVTTMDEIAIISFNGLKNLRDPPTEQVVFDDAVTKHFTKKQKSAVPVDVLQLIGDLSKYSTNRPTKNDKNETNVIDWREEMKNRGDEASNPSIIAKYMDMFTLFG